MKKDINIEIGQRVLTARRQARLSRDELAEKLNISTLFMGYIECGQKGMSLTTLKNLCKILGVSADYILLGETENITQKNIGLLLNSIDVEYLPIVEHQLKEFLLYIDEIDKLHRKKYIQIKEEPLNL